MSVTSLWYTGTVIGNSRLLAFKVPLTDVCEHCFSLHMGWFVFRLVLLWATLVMLCRGMWSFV